MAVKYFCPNCERRFVEWGAQKLDFKCPTEGCEQKTLLLLGSADLDGEDKPKAKRPKKAKSIVPLTNPEDDISELDGGFIDEDSDLDEEEEELEEEEEEVLATPVVAVVDDDDTDDVSVDDDEAADDDTFVEALDLDDDVAIEED